MAEKPYPSPSKLSEQLVNLSWRIAVELRAIYNTIQTRLTQDDADKLYLGIKGKAASATTADSATKATQDGSGNVITQTYAKNSALPATMKAATASAAGSGGLVPQPTAGANAKFLRGDATWQSVTVPTKTSQLTNDSGFLTQHQDLSGYATTASLSSYATTASLSSYATTASLSSYATTASLSAYAKTTAIPTKTSQLTNDSGYLTTHQSLDGYVKATSGTEDLTAGTSALATGEVYFVYE